MNKNRRQLIDIQLKLITAIKNGRSDKWLLRLWSRFIKTRDQYKCVVCSSTERLQAHHIFRRSLYPYGWFQPGNGITLCLECHDRQHAKFNRSPDSSMPVDAQGGDNLDDAFYYFDSLIKNANEQKLNHDDFYYIDEHMLIYFMQLQGCEHMKIFLKNEKYSKLEIAHEIWRTSPPNIIRTLMRANTPQ
jgi:hypothetical protein